ncbi:MAG: N-acetylmuramic acid 6-phosphate etherase [Candidatus Gastranaerophilales bacterium]|nr:N-acetylmuramic acid 6-phosphate etherase [Candidatus Gastranaerophilales bacterium]
MLELSKTEAVNPLSKDIDKLESLEIVKIINDEDKKVAQTIETELPSIAKAVDIISENFLQNGRLIYFGAGTSGRLGVLDASECPPTFNVPSSMVVGVIAGGDIALRNAIEGAEDSVELAKTDFKKLQVSSNDTICVISASGNANYVVEILKIATKSGCKRISVSSNRNAKIKQNTDVFICVETGAEVVTGSTRMKAGTSQKLVLNMLTTASMIKIGKTYENYMIDVKPTNIKLKDRAERIVSAIVGIEQNKAKTVLQDNGYKVKEAVLTLKYGVETSVATELLASNNGVLRKVFEKLDV